MDVWRLREPVLAAWPATPEMTEAIATLMGLAGEVGSGIAVFLCFVGLLRIGEALSATWEHLYLPSPTAERQEGSLYLPKTKRGEAYVPLTDPRVLAILRRHRRRTGGRGKICNTTYGRFRKLLQFCIQTLRIPALRFRSHSFRRGGATWVLQQTRSVEYTVILGRWASVMSARRYLKQGEALLARLLAEMTLETAARIEALRGAAENVFL